MVSGLTAAEVDSSGNWETEQKSVKTSTETCQLLITLQLQSSATISVFGDLLAEKKIAWSTLNIWVQCGLQCVFEKFLWTFWLFLLQLCFTIGKKKTASAVIPNWQSQFQSHLSTA